MSLFRKVLLGIGGLLLLLVVAAYLLPRNVHVERSTTISAPRATVFTVVNSFKHFNKWSPWAELDPNAKYSYNGPSSGVGAGMSWVGDPSTMGSGSQVITASTPWASVTTDIDFGPQGKAVGVFSITAEGPATRVLWALDTDLGMNPVSRYFGLMIDGMVGRDFDKGLARLKTLVESLPKGDFADLQIEVATVVPSVVAYVPASSGKDDASFAAAVGKAYGEVGAFMKTQKLNRAGAPVTIDTGASDTGVLFDAAIPIDKAPTKAIASGARVQVKLTYGGKVLKVALKGPYSQIPATYGKIAAYIAAHGIDTNGSSWNEFANDPTTVKESEILTNIYFPIK
jgi:effector-binding domain-containing protein